MSEDVDSLTVQYEENGVVLVKEVDKEILSKGAWATVLFRYRNLNKATGDFGEDMYSIRRYQKRQGAYIPKSKFNISSPEQARKIIEALTRWTSNQVPTNK
ncbi:hypothetical protein [Desulfofustis limnaeus]|jgi:hypothetical protein|uniref:Uncharacterized protein n=1 Tax=Desulfofustis limnaeus TaxID=2740163 RepID=A0ABM7WB03_9BACT|nr:hypothetical protein [Desulfofustis limnaeus]MDX9894447.1 hypothetical protein [Desulfofustis sp.]BDD88087.1 hypothetical protein DPPLL_24520 [Desulfofustis limnaeus]